MDRLLTVVEAAEQMNTSPRFVRRLVAERRITFVRLGRLVRVPSSAVRELIDRGTVEPLPVRRHGRRGVA